MEFWPYNQDIGRDYEAEELEELENAQLEILPQELPVFVWAPEYRSKLKPDKQTLDGNVLLIGFNGAGAIFLHAHFERKVVVGALYLPGEDMDENLLKDPNIRNKMCIIYELEDQPSVFLVACQYDIAPEQSPLWAETLLNHIIPKRTVIFDSFTTYQFKSATEDTSPPLLRKLKSSTAEEIDRCEFLEPPSLVTGHSAAVLSLLEMQQKPGYLYISLLEMQLGRYDVSIDTLRALEPTLKALNSAGMLKTAVADTPDYINLLGMFSKKDVNHLYM